MQSIDFLVSVEGAVVLVSAGVFAVVMTVLIDRVYETRETRET
jgi:hypothetical protein